MPELPEVEVTRRGVAPHIEGRTVQDVVLRREGLRWPFPAQLQQLLAGRTVLSTGRRGKYLLVHFEHGTLIIHLGMSGHLRVMESGIEPEKHDHFDLVVERADGGPQVLRMKDPRRFGAVLWHDAADGALDSHVLLRTLGVEPLEAGFSGKLLHDQTRGRSAPIKQVLLAGDIVVGVGNIYASESLFRAGINPKTPARRISLARYDKLAQAIREILAEAIVQGGSTLRDFISVNGQSGYFQQTYFVYDRAGVPCKGFRTLQRLAPGRGDRVDGVPGVGGRGRAAGRGHRAAHRPHPGPAGRRQAVGGLRGGIFARQIGTDQRHLLCRLRPAHPALLGRTHHHVPDRADVRCRPAAVAAPAAHRNPGRQSLHRRLPPPACRLDRAAARPGRRRRHARDVQAGQHDAPGAGGGSAPLRPVRRRRSRHGGHAGRARHGGDFPVAPRDHQLPASAAQTGTGDPRYARPECDRHRARADAQPDPQRPRRAVHPGRRHGRDPQRHRGVAQPHRRRRRSHGRAQQDRQHVGRAAHRGRGRRRDRAPAGQRGARAGRGAAPGVSRVRAKSAGGQDHARPGPARTQPPAGAGGGAVRGTDPRQAGPRAAPAAGRPAGAGRGPGGHAGRPRARHRRAVARAAQPARQEPDRDRTHDAPHRRGKARVRCQPVQTASHALRVYAPVGRAVHEHRHGHRARRYRPGARTDAAQPLFPGRARGGAPVFRAHPRAPRCGGQQDGGNLRDDGRDGAPLCQRTRHEPGAARAVPAGPAANNDAEAWLKVIMAPLEAQIRQHKDQLKYRQASIQRIHDATDSLEHKIAAQEAAQRALEDQKTQLQQLADAILFRSTDRLAKTAWPPRLALAEHARRLPGLAVRNHVAANPGLRRARLLRAFPRALSHAARSGRSAGRGRDGAVERPGLLHARAQLAQVRAVRGGQVRWRVPVRSIPAGRAARHRPLDRCGDLGVFQRHPRSHHGRQRQARVRARVRHRHLSRRAQDRGSHVAPRRGAAARRRHRSVHAGADGPGRHAVHAQQSGVRALSDANALRGVRHGPHARTAGTQAEKNLARKTCADAGHRRRRPGAARTAPTHRHLGRPAVAAGTGRPRAGRGRPRAGRGPWIAAAGGGKIRGDGSVRAPVDGHACLYPLQAAHRAVPCHAGAAPGHGCRSDLRLGRCGPAGGRRPAGADQEAVIGVGGGWQGGAAAHGFLKRELQRRHGGLVRRSVDVAGDGEGNADQGKRSSDKPLDEIGFHARHFNVHFRKPNVHLPELLSDFTAQSSNVHLAAALVGHALPDFLEPFDNAPVFADRVAVGHAGNIVGNLARLPAQVARSAGLVLVIGRQQHRFRHEGIEQLAHDAAGLHAHAVDLVVAVQVLAQEALELGRILAHGIGKADQRGRQPHVVEIARRHVGQQRARGDDQVVRQRRDQAAQRFVDGAPARQAREGPLHVLVQAGKEIDLLQLLDGDQAGTQTVVDVVAVVGDFVGQVGQLRFQRRLGTLDEADRHRPQLTGIGQRAVLEDALAGFEHQIQAVVRAIVFFQLVHHAQALQVVLEAAVILHALVEHILAHVAERRMAQVVRQRNRFHQVFVQAQIARDGAAHLRHFQAVREAGAEQVAFVVKKNLGLVFEPAERRRMDDAVAVALELAARRVRRLRRGQQQFLRRVGDAGRAQRLEQDELDGAAFVLLVHFHQFQPALGAQVGRLDGQAGRRHQRAHARHGRRLDQAHAVRQVGRHHHAATDGFAVQPCAVAEAGLDGVAERVAEIEDGAQAAFALVLAHDLGLDFARAGDGIREGALVARHQQADIGFDPVEERGVDDGAVLDHLSQAGRQFAVGQGFQGGRIGNHCARLVKRADHVLAQRMVDAGLAAHRRIDLRQQGGGHLDKVHAAHIAGGGVPGEVADHAAAEGDQRGLAVGLVGQQGVEDLHQAGPVLELFAVGQHHRHHLLAGGAQGRFHALEVQRRDGGVGDDGDLAAVDVARQQRRIVEQGRSDGNRIAALAEVDIEQNGGFFVHRWLGMGGAVGRGFARQLLELIQDGLHHGLYVRTARIDHDVGNVQVQRIAHRHQLFELLARIGRLQQRAVLVVRGALQDAVDRRAQVDHGAARLEQRAAVGVEHGAAAGGQHQVLLARQLADHLGLAAAEAGLPLDLEDPRNGRARARLDLVVGVDEAQPQFAGQDAADGVGIAARRRHPVWADRARRRDILRQVHIEPVHAVARIHERHGGPPRGVGGHGGRDGDRNARLQLAVAVEILARVQDAVAVDVFVVACHLDHGRPRAGGGITELSLVVAGRQHRRRQPHARHGVAGRVGDEHGVILLVRGAVGGADQVARAGADEQRALRHRDGGGGRGSRAAHDAGLDLHAVGGGGRGAGNEAHGGRTVGGRGHVGRLGERTAAGVGQDGERHQRILDRIVLRRAVAHHRAQRDLLGDAASRVDADHGRIGLHRDGGNAGERRHEFQLGLCAQGASLGRDGGHAGTVGVDIRVGRAARQRQRPGQRHGAAGIGVHRAARAADGDVAGAAAGAAGHGHLAARPDVAGGDHVAGAVEHAHGKRRRVDCNRRRCRLAQRAHGQHVGAAAAGRIREDQLPGRIGDGRAAALDGQRIGVGRERHRLAHQRIAGRIDQLDGDVGSRTGIDGGRGVDRQPVAGHVDHGGHRRGACRRGGDGDRARAGVAARAQFFRDDALGVGGARGQGQAAGAALEIDHHARHGAVVGVAHQRHHRHLAAGHAGRSQRARVRGERQRGHGRHHGHVHRGRRAPARAGRDRDSAQRRVARHAQFFRHLARRVGHAVGAAHGAGTGRKAHRLAHQRIAAAVLDDGRQRHLGAGQAGRGDGGGAGLDRHAGHLGRRGAGAGTAADRAGRAATAAAGRQQRCTGGRCQPADDAFHARSLSGYFSLSVAQHGHVAQQRHLAGGIALGLLIDAAQHHRTAVFHHDLGLDVLGVDGKAGPGFLAHAVLVDIDVDHHVAVRRDLRRDFQPQVGLAELDRRGAAAGGHLVRQLDALLDQRHRLVGRDHARAGDDLAGAVRFQRGQLQVQETVGGRREQADGQAAGVDAVDAGGRQVDELGVVVAAGRRCDLPRGLAHARDVAADGKTVVAAADLVAGIAAAHGAHVGKAQLGAEVAGKGIARFHDARLDQHLLGGDVGLGDQAPHVLDLGRHVGHEQLVGARLDDGAAAPRQHPVLGVAAGVEPEHGAKRLGLLIVELEDFGFERLQVGDLGALLQFQLFLGEQFFAGRDP
uniref:Formamidopyrimidine-DNA glycosylase catalytic domain-containing protein n=1 Tax=Tanacetum cinerariifolium TaxID=118510 RepID=A0A699GFQ9_TANCI|nr:hypothetical protein [Tanacetum cinerariifolium]